MPKSQKDKKYTNLREQHYYKESGKKVFHIEDKKEQEKIDAFMKRHSTTPASTARESGFSSYLFEINKVRINKAMLQKQKTDEGTYFLSRSSAAPKLPVSCLASAEHVVAMQDEVSDFKSELEPATKQQVMYQVLLSCSTKRLNVKRETAAILKKITQYDESLNKNNVSITYNKEKRIFDIQVSTQVADIQLLIRSLTSVKKYNITSCDFADISLNQGVCLVKEDTSNPIHALVNIADSDGEKGFLERDAGTTSGLNASSYQDSNWTFNFFKNLDDMLQQTAYPRNTFAIKIFKP
ncbi:hypothetical protein [Legionella fallonii]|uniref:Uncharacterized protein n=1 Tax=Legionella fallonii LLAP-10 TaxID=1212491 RepID=A0A098G6R3_9GAMM|nr:hypothetical protein [Legionella fallonii]CEG57674.1 conserved protein of unknown function [Legionella fallonii LLAP-10]